MVDVGAEVEPNNTFVDANPISLGNTISGVISAIPVDGEINVFVNDLLAGRVVVTWNLVPEYPVIGSNTVQASLFSDGRIMVTYSGITSDDAIVGLAPFEADGFVEVDFSVDTPFSTSAPVAIFEEFDGPEGPDASGEDAPGTKPFDLDGHVLTFAPNIDGGYDVKLFDLGGPLPPAP